MDTKTYFFPENVKQEPCEESNPNHRNKLRRFNGIETSLKQGETKRVSGFNFHVSG